MGVSVAAQIRYKRTLNLRISTEFPMTAAAKSTPAIAELSFETALKELENIVRNLESGNVELERAIADYTRGAALKDHCMKKLADAKLKVEKITFDGKGTTGVQAFDIQE
jgi:exodeoxyribonuclease VII small subunit